MRLTRANVLLLVALAGLVAAEIGLQRSGPVEREIERLFPDLFRDRAARFLLEGAGVSVEGRRTTEGTWILPEHFDHPANEVSVDLLLTALTSLTTLDLLSEDPARHGSYRVGQGQALVVRVWDEQGELLAALVQGAEVDGATYVRRLAQDAVYRAPRLRTIRLDPRLWLETRWLAFEPATVTEVRLGGTLLERRLVLQRDPTSVERWSVEGGADVRPQRVKDLLRVLQTLHLEGVVAPRMGEADFGEPQLELSLGFLDGATASGLFGATTPEGGVLACRDPQTFVVRFGRATWELLRGQLAELVR